MPIIYRCPSEENEKSQQTNYVVIVGPKYVGGLVPEDRNLDFISSHAGTSTTLLVVEVPDSGIHWMEPRDLTIDEIIERLKNHQMSAHQGGFNVAFCDGHVNYIREDVAPETLRSLADPNYNKPKDYQ